MLAISVHDPERRNVSAGLRAENDMLAVACILSSEAVPDRAAEDL